MFLQESLKTMHISFWKTDLNRNFFPKLHIIHVYTIFILDFLQFCLFIVSRPWGNMVMDSLPLFRFQDKLNPKEPNFKLVFLSDFKLLFSFLQNAHLMIYLWDYKGKQTISWMYKFQLYVQYTCTNVSAIFTEKNLA